MEFANATYLWGLLGLLLPIAIHLWSRKKVITIKVGSTKLLQASEPKQTSSVRLNEWWLLFLRLLTVLLLVLILAEPSITKTLENTSVSYLIEPSLINDHRVQVILDTIPKESVRVLVKEFPAYDDYIVTDLEKTPEYWQLAQDMSSISADSLIIFSRGFLKGLSGIRPTIQANTRWIVLEAEGVLEKTIAVTQKHAVIEFLSVSSDAKTFTFKKDTISMHSDVFEFDTAHDKIRLKSSTQNDWMRLQKNTPFRVGIQQNDSLMGQLLYVKAAYRAISKFLNVPIEIEVLNRSVNIDDFNTIIAFGDSVPKSTKGTVLIYKPDELATQLIENGPSPNIFHLTGLLDSENIVSKHLPEKLLTLLKRNEDLKNIIKVNDQRIVAESELQPVLSSVGKINSKVHQFKITPWLWLFLILVTIVERLLSKLRKQ